MICTPHQILLHDKIMEDEVGGACDTYGRERTQVEGFGRKLLREETTWKT